MRINLFVVLIFCTSCTRLFYANNINDNSSTLQLIHIIFRHGARTIDPMFTYPTDPYKNITFYPYGVNELTMTGKVQMFQLGKIIRKQYHSFLGKRYMPNQIEAVSSYYNRSKVSLELVLAALFPPLDDEIFEPGLNWQPIPYFHSAKKSDNFFLTSKNCPNYYKELVSYQKTAKFAKIYEPDKDVFKYVEKHSQTTMFSYIDLMGIQNNLLVEQELGLPLPKWAIPVYSELVNLTFKGYSFQTSTTNLARITAGYVIKRLIDDMKQKMLRASFMLNKKIIIFSAHDATIAVLLGALKVFKLPLPQYGSRVVVELHKINKTYGFKLFYNPELSEKIELLVIPGCEEFCTLEKFMLITKELMPGPQTCGNEVYSEKNTSSRVFSNIFLNIFWCSFLFLYNWFTKSKK